MSFFIIILICLIIGSIFYFSFGAFWLECQDRIKYLEQCLAKKDWFNANIVTNNLFHDVVFKKFKRSYNYIKEKYGEDPIESFPCSILDKIDKLWMKYSNGHFGLSVQKQIYEKCAEEFRAMSDYERNKLIRKINFDFGSGFMDATESLVSFNNGKVCKEFLLIDKLGWYFKVTWYPDGDISVGIAHLSYATYSLNDPPGHLPMISFHRCDKLTLEDIREIMSYRRNDQGNPYAFISDGGPRLTYDDLDLKLMIALWKRLESCGS